MSFCFLSPRLAQVCLEAWGATWVRITLALYLYIKPDDCQNKKRQSRKTADLGAFFIRFLHESKAPLFILTSFSFSKYLTLTK